MARALQIAHLVLLLTAAGLCVCGGWFLWSLTQTAASLRTDVAKFGATADQLSATLATINRPCGAGRPCGTLADIGKTLNTARLTLGQVEVAANHEDKRIGVLDEQETQIAADTNHVLLGASEAIVSARATIEDIQPSEAELEVELREMQRATAAITTLATDPNLRQMAANLNGAAANAKSTLAHADATTSEVQQAVHSYLHPTWPHRIWHGITNTGLEAAKFFW